MVIVIGRILGLRYSRGVEDESPSLTLFMVVTDWANSVKEVASQPKRKPNAYLRHWSDGSSDFKHCFIGSLPIKRI